jgi:hypothetical protein
MRKEEGTTPEEEPECTPSLRMVTCSLDLEAESGAEDVGVARLEVAAGEAAQRRGDPHGVVVTAAAAGAGDEISVGLTGSKGKGVGTCRGTR